jgi:hypothetical protein
MTGTNSGLLLRLCTHNIAPGQAAANDAHGMEWRAEIHAGLKARTPSNV